MLQAEPITSSHVDLVVQDWRLQRGREWRLARVNNSGLVDAVYSEQAAHDLFVALTR